MKTTTKSLPAGCVQSRREFLQTLGTGLLISIPVQSSVAQENRPSRTAGPLISHRVHIGTDGTITVMTGKIEMGQGSRAEISQAAAEELRVPVSQIQLIMGDTSLVPDDGITAGSRTTPATLPAVRQGSAAARMALIELAAQKWNRSSSDLTVSNGQVTDPKNGQVLTYAQLAVDPHAEELFRRSIPADTHVTPVQQWKVMGTSIARPNGHDLVTGQHQFPSDLSRPRMWYGKILRPPTYGARLESIDLKLLQEMKDVVMVREGDFIGVAAPSSFAATEALELLATTARWSKPEHPSSDQVHAYLKQKVRNMRELANPFTESMQRSTKAIRQSYRTAYIQHAPLETRVALAEWDQGLLTVWTGTQNPFGYRSELANAFGLPQDKVRIIVPDFGSGFGGKHTAETAIEAARLARAAQRPVKVKWTREEEFTWAYYRPAALIEVEACLDERGNIDIWHFVNINSGGAAIETPYRAAHSHCRFVSSESPLRQGSYRTLAATANNFARECAMDELAQMTGADPLAFRLDRLDLPRLRAVLERAAKEFDWMRRRKNKKTGAGIGLACGTEKGSFVAACVEVSINRQRQEIQINQLCEAFECGAIVNPDNLRRQVLGCILMGLGGALWEEMAFAQGNMLNPGFSRYRVPRFADVPPIDIHLIERPDLPSVGGGETPIIALAPAIANALFDLTGTRFRQMPIRLGA